MGVRSLTRREHTRRYHSDAVRAARKRRVYEREATAEELDGDLAVLRAVRDAAQSRRTWIAVLIAVFLVAGVLLSLNVQNPGPIIVAVGLAIVLGILRKMTRVWD